MKEKLQKINLQTKFFAGSALLAGLYFFIMWINNYIATSVNHTVCKTSKGMYWMEWILPILIVWAGVFLILEMKEMLTLVCVTGCSVLLAFGGMFYDHVLTFIVNENPLFKEDYGLEWKMWGSVVILFLFLLPFVHKKVFHGKPGRRATFLAVTLVLASVGGILITIQDFGTYSIYILARTLALLLISVFALYMKSRLEKENGGEVQPEQETGSTWKAVAEDCFWLLTGIGLAVLYIMIPRPLYTHMNIPVYRFSRSEELSVGMFLFLGILMYQLFKEKKKMPKGWFGTGCAVAGVVLLNNIVFLVVSLLGEEGGAWDLGYLLRSRALGLFRGVYGSFLMQVSYLFLFLTLAWVFYFLKMKKMQILNSILGISSIWFCLIQGMRDERYSYRSSITAATGMLILFLAPLFPVIFAKVKKLPVFLSVALLGLYEVTNILYLVKMRTNLSQAGRFRAGNMTVFVVCQGFLVLLLGISIVYDWKTREE